MVKQVAVSRARTRLVRPSLGAIWVLLPTLAFGRQGAPGAPPDPPPPCDPSLPSNKALVWRDDNGVPHIEALSEEHAWKALGYEEARDALFSVQANIKRFRGQQARYFASGNTSVPWNDIVVKKLRLHLGDALTGTTLQKLNKLKTLLRRTNAPTGRQDQVFLNLESYAQGLEAYRQHFAFPTPSNPRNPQEEDYKAWLDDPDLDKDNNPSTGQNFKWVYTEIDPSTGVDLAKISVFDVASAGSWSAGTDHFVRAQNKDPFGTPPPEATFLTSSEAHNHPPFLDAGDLAITGSNAFCWVNSPNMSYMPPELLGGQFRGAMVADPHQGYYSHAFKKNAKLFHSENGGRLFAHLRVCQVVEPINVFGWKRAATGMFSAFFNKDLAIGGSVGAGNGADAFLLRVMPEGETDAPPTHYFSYHTGGWEPLVAETVDDIAVRMANGTLLTPVYRLKRAGPFGFIPVKKQETSDGSWDIVPFYAEDWPDEQPDWRVGIEGGNVFSAKFDPGVAELRVVVAYRSPLHPLLNPNEIQVASNPQRHYYRLAVGAYEAIIAHTVDELQEQLESHDLAGGPNILAADRDGRIFGTSATAIPQRGNADIFTYGEPNNVGHIGTDDIADIYDQEDREPVPARYLKDMAFEWVFLNGLPPTGVLQYLVPAGKGTDANQKYQPYIYFDQSQSSCNEDACAHSHTCLNTPPQDIAPIAVDNTYENPGFATISNNDPHFAYKRDLNPLAEGSSCPAAPGRDKQSPDNQIVDYQLQTGTSYASRSPDLFSLEKNANIVDTLLNIATGARPLMDSAAALSFAIDNRSYVPRGYAGYRDATGFLHSPDPSKPACPVPVRNLQELQSRISDVLDEARNERRFFLDLWNTLRQTWPSTYYEAWVLQQQPVVWFPDPNNDTITQTVELPQDYSLLDFLWSESRLGKTRVEECSPGCLLTTYERSRFAELVDQLLDWSNEEFRNAKDSVAAGLLFQYDLGFNAATNGLANGSAVIKDEEARVWTPLYHGKVGASSARFDSPNAYPVTCLSALDPVTGLLPVGWDPENSFMACASPPVAAQEVYLFRYYAPYKRFADLVFSSNPMASIMYDCDLSTFEEEAKRHPIMRIPKPPYEALYDDVPNYHVKATPTPQDITALVRFFVEDLGGFTLVPERLILDPGIPDAPFVDGGITTTSKTEKISNWLNNPNPLITPKNANLPYPYYYPLTRNLVRILLIKRLLEADEFMSANSLGTLGSILQSRVHDFNHTLQYAPGPCDYGSIREVGLLVPVDATDPDGDEDDLGNASKAKARGFQARVWAGGGSDKTMVILFPYDSNKYPATFFLHYPGTRQSAFESPHFAGMVDHFRNRTLAPTHFTDYKERDPATGLLRYKSPDTVAFGINPYFSPP